MFLFSSFGLLRRYKQKLLTHTKKKLLCSRDCLLVTLLEFSKSLTSQEFWNFNSKESHWTFFKISFWTSLTNFSHPQIRLTQACASRKREKPLSSFNSHNVTRNSNDILMQWRFFIFQNILKPLFIENLWMGAFSSSDYLLTNCSNWWENINFSNSQFEPQIYKNIYFHAISTGIDSRKFKIRKGGKNLRSIFVHDIFSIADCRHGT